MATLYNAFIMPNGRLVWCLARSILILQKSIRKLTPPFIKFEDNSLHYAPSWKEYGIPSNFRPIYVGEAAGRSIFHKASPEYLKRKYCFLQFVFFFL